LPEPVTPGDRRPDRTDAERSADHAEGVGRERPAEARQLAVAQQSSLV
jgi:hypothetical protein